MKDTNCPNLAGGLRVPTGEAAGGIFCKFLRVIRRPASIASVIVGITLSSSSGVLKSLCRIFFKEFLKENDDRLWDIFESLKR